MPATAAEATRAQPTTAGDEPERADRRDPGVRDTAAPDWSEIVQALSATDEDDVPLFGRLPA